MSRRRIRVEEVEHLAGGAGAAAEPQDSPGGGSGWRWLFGGSLLLGALVGGVAIAWWLFLNIVVTIVLEDQPIGIRLPEEFSAVAEVTNNLDVAMDGQIRTTVPFRQELIVPVRGRYDFDVALRADVPLKFTVAYEGILPVNTEADVTIRTGINYKNLKALRNLEIKTALPLEFPLPVNLNIPVEDTIDLRYEGPLSADIDHDIVTFVDTQLRTSLPIKQTINAPVTAALPLQVRPSQEQVRLILSRMVIDLMPSSMLKIGLAEDVTVPVRVDNPYGPLDAGGVDGEDALPGEPTAVP